MLDSRWWLVPDKTNHEDSIPSSSKECRHISLPLLSDYPSMLDSSWWLVPDKTNHEDTGPSSSKECIHIGPPFLGGPPAMLDLRSYLRLGKQARGTWDKRKALVLVTFLRSPNRQKALRGLAVRNYAADYDYSSSSS